MTARRGRLQSPLYPAPYPASVECEWDVQVRPGRTIKVRFEGLRLDPSQTTDCPRSYVIVSLFFLVLILVLFVLILVLVHHLHLIFLFVVVVVVAFVFLILVLFSSSSSCSRSYYFSSPLLPFLTFTFLLTNVL